MLMLLPSVAHPVILRDTNGGFRGVQQVRDVAVFPGAFNPLHAGHVKLRKAAEQILGVEVIFELSLSNAEKLSVREDELAERLQQFGGHRVALTNAPLFLHKASLFPGCCFVVGFDTAARVIDPAFYENSSSAMHSALEQLRLLRHRFLVGGRLQSDGVASQFCSVRDLAVPSEYVPLFRGIEERDFREDISSTQLRENSYEPGG